MNNDISVKKFLENKHNNLFLIQNKKKNIGYIRFEQNKLKKNISWALLKKFHNKGIISKNLKTLTSNKNIKYSARIKKKNIASLKMAFGPFTKWKKHFTAGSFIHFVKYYFDNRDY